MIYCCSCFWDSYEFQVEANEESIITITIHPTIKKKIHPNPISLKAVEELNEYFNGKRKRFNVPFFLSGTDFQKRVWNAASDILYGEVMTYGEIAKIIKKPNAFRAVGNALNKNPIPIIIPCHRVIGKKDSLGGFAVGTILKKKLLDMEKENMRRP